MRRLFMLVATLAIPASGLTTLALNSGQAWAKGGPNGKMTCTSVSGTVAGTITVSGCSDSGSATATASDPLPATALATGGTVTWTNGKTTVVSAPTVTSTNPKHCPGYVKDAATEPTADKFVGGVTSDNSGLKVPGTIKGEVCVSLTGNITDAKAIKIS
jgi:hypothetical protein